MYNKINFLYKYYLIIIWNKQINNSLLLEYLAEYSCSLQYKTLFLHTYDFQQFTIYKTYFSTTQKKKKKSCYKLIELFYFYCISVGEYAGAQGLGLLRLHSTFRHDLKIYASDEGRVQMTAAAFAKGLLALEGELTPILVQMVKSANTNGLLDNDCDSSKYQNM